MTKRSGKLFVAYPDGSRWHAIVDVIKRADGHNDVRLPCGTYLNEHQGNRWPVTDEQLERQHFVEHDFLSLATSAVKACEGGDTNAEFWLNKFHAGPYWGIREGLEASKIWMLQCMLDLAIYENQPQETIDELCQRIRNAKHWRKEYGARLGRWAKKHYAEIRGEQR